MQRRLLRIAASVALSAVSVGCLEDDYDPCRGVPKDIERAVEYLNDHPAQAGCLLPKLESARPGQLCEADRDKDGMSQAEEVIRFARSRIATAPSEHPSIERWAETETNTELFLRVVAGKCPEWQPEAAFLTVMFKVAQSLPPLLDLISLVQMSKDELVDPYRYRWWVTPIMGVISPGNACLDKGLARCGREVSAAVEAMRDAIHGSFPLEDVVVKIGGQEIDLSGTYNEPVFRLFAAIGELVYGAMYFLAAHVDINSLPGQYAEGLGIRFIDNGDGRVGGCDQLQVNLGFGHDVFSDYCAEGAQRGCTGTLLPNSFQFPATTSKDATVNYDAMFAGASLALDKFRRSIGDKSITFSFDDINLFLNPIGGKSLPKVMEFRPAVLFESGLSAFTPGRPGTKVGNASAIKDYFEMEVNQDAQACPEAKTSTGLWNCKNKDGKRDYSSSIFRGDADHFNNHIAKDSLFVSESLLDKHGLGPKTFFRASEGGGYLPYIEFKYPDLKGFMRVDEGLITSMTDPGTPLCEREIGSTLTGRMTATDTRFLNALFNFAILQGKVCGNSTLKEVGDKFACAGLFTPLAAGAVFSSCEMDWGCSEDLACEDEDLFPTCGADDFSCRQVVPVASPQGLALLANGLLNVGIVLLPLGLWPILRRRKSRR